MTSNQEERIYDLKVGSKTRLVPVRDRPGLLQIKAASLTDDEGVFPLRITTALLRFFESALRLALRQNDTIGVRIERDGSGARIKSIIPPVPPGTDSYK